MLLSSFLATASWYLFSTSKVARMMASIPELSGRCCFHWTLAAQDRESQLSTRCHVVQATCMMRSVTAVWHTTRSTDHLLTPLTLLRMQHAECGLCSRAMLCQ